MTRRFPSSRIRFEQYKAELQERNGRAAVARKQQRDRSALELVRSFLHLMRGYRRSVAFSLATLTLATVLALLPPAATKFVVDYVLGGKPVPERVPAWVPRDPWPLLLPITLARAGDFAGEDGLHIWGRWHATRVTKLLQMSVRKRVFDHAVRLPMHRVQELKSGGAASVLRQDAGSVGDLVFGMLYNPWRAVIQLLGSLLILAWVDWRLLLGALVIVPMVYFTHRTWIGRIRPQHRQRACPARGGRRDGHRIVRRHARGAGIQAAAVRDEPHHAGQSRDGAAGTVRLVVDANDRDRLGNADAAGQRRPAALRRLAGAAGST